PTPTPTPSPTPTATPTATATPSPTPTGRVLHVDVVNGSDDTGDGLSPATAWRTLTHALGLAQAGDLFLVAPGLYENQLSVPVTTPNVTIRGTGQPGDVRISPIDPLAAGIKVNGAAGVTLENLWIHGGRRGILAVGATDGLVVRDVVITASSQNGIRVLKGNGVTIERTTITGVATHAIFTSKTHGVQLRDDLLYANQGSGLRIARSEADVAFCTIYSNGSGVRVIKSALALRDSIVANHGAGPGIFIQNTGVEPVAISFSLLFANNPDVAPPTTPLGFGMILGQPPGFVSDAGGIDPDGADGILGGTAANPDGWKDDVLLLQQVRGGQTVQSPAVDNGSDTVETLGITGSTAVGGAPDILQADMGAHR
ncbi:MAG TPA: right-handed parallel beta-helix repeat-containing protein, partial [Candidatus Binatia bacterium]|nr:right-handed parallel beta-helix repeat-containing protein [Candidatus Binatia bacterium]